MSAVQIKGFPLAGLLTNVNPENLKKPETAARSLLAIVSTENLIKPNTARVSLLSIVKVQNLAKLSTRLTKPHFGILSKPDIGIIRNLTKPDSRSAENLAEWLSRVVTENLSKLDMESAGMLTNVDIESGEMMTNDDIFTLYEDKNGPSSQEFSDSIKKSAATSTRRELFAPVRAREEGFFGITTRGGNHATGGSFRRSTRARGEFCESVKKGHVECLQSIKKGLQSHCPSIYGYRAPAKSGAGIGVPEMYKATHDAPSVFFCVLAFDHPFFSVAVIIRVAHEIMVGWMGAEKSAPVTLYAGYANPVQLTTSEIGVSGGGITSQYKEAATWLLPSPKNRLSSGAFIPASNPVISLYLLLLNQKPAPYYPTARACSLPVFVQGALMLSYFIVYGYGVNQHGLTIGINHKSRAESQESAKATAMLKAQDSGLSLIRITRVQEVAA